MQKLIARMRLCMVLTSTFLWGYGCGQNPSFSEVATPNSKSIIAKVTASQSADAIVSTSNNNDSNTASSPDEATAGGTALGSTSTNQGGSANGTTTNPNGGSGSGQPSNTLPAGTVPIPAVNPLNSLSWFWQCSAQPVAAPQPVSNNDPVIVGTGTYSVNRAFMHNTPITIEGQLCQPAQMKRDIVFVIDVSGSMSNQEAHDPRHNNSCGRLTALQTVLASVAQDGLTRFGLVTFNDSVQVTTSGFSTSTSALYNNVLGTSKELQLADVVCAGNGGTNYDEALAGASAILQSSTDTNTSKEIYFISDGEPDPSRYDGIAVANRLKAGGVTIATLMLIGNGSGLQKIASIDQTDPAKTRLLYMKVTAAAQLAQTLTQLAQNFLTSGTIKYRAIGSNQWVSYDLMTVQQNYRFQLVPFHSDAQLAPNGLEVSLDYWDTRGTHYGNVGKLLWSN